MNIKNIFKTMNKQKFMLQIVANKILHIITLSNQYNI